MLRDNLLNRKIFYAQKELKVLIEKWRHQYDNVCPHSSLDRHPPALETILPNPVFSA
jgi:transposase InsO family protein